MPINKRLSLLLLLPAFVFLCGFSWNFGTDKCKEAMEQATRLPLIKDDTDRGKSELKITTLCPDGAAASYVAGQQAERAGDIDGAISHYRRALQGEPSLAVASGSLGMLYLQKGLVDEASVALTKGVAGAPSPAFHMALAKIMLDKHLFPLAMYHIKEAAAIAPEDPAIMVARAEIYLAQGQMDMAHDEYRRALVVDSSLESAAVGIAALLIQKGQQDKALEILKKASVANPRSSRIHLMLADIYEKKGDRKQAEYERLLGGKKVSLLTELPPLAEGVVLGDQLAEKGETDKAAEAYRAEQKRKPDSVVPYERLGNLYFKAGDRKSVV